MPQYPDFAGKAGDGFLYALPKADILAFLAGEFEVLKALEIPLIASGLRQKADEALFLTGDKIVTLYETNGSGVNPSPIAHRFDWELTAVDAIPFPHIAYRVTDVTELDENGRFWAINYFFPGDRELAVKTDPLAEQFGQGPTHRQYDYVERLVEFQYSDSGVSFTGAPPIQLQLIAKDARNWEGIVRLDDRGFLLATDKYPETILGFVSSNR